MKTKQLILAGLIALTTLVNAQWISTPPFITTNKDYVGIYFGGPPSWTPSYPFHVIQNDPTAGSAQTAGYFDYTATQTGNHFALVGIAKDPGGLATELAGVIGDAFDGYNTYGGSFSAGNSNGTGGVTIGCYAKLDPVTGPNSAGICAGVYGDDWSTGGSGGSGPNWGGFFIGDVYTSSSSYYTSDRKFKSNILPMTNALDKILQLKPSTYTFKLNEFTGLSFPKGEQMGLIAQDLEKIFPELVKETGLPGRDEKGKVIATGETFKTVNYMSLIPLLISGMQEQQKQIVEQRELINSLLLKSSNSTGLNELNSINDFSVSQNEPNPFDQKTVVKYTLPVQIKTAQMVVYDLSGKQLVSFPITERGSSSITLTSEKLAAGIYIYSIIADGKIVDSKRMIVAEK